MNPGTKQELSGAAKHSLKKKIIVSGNKKSARSAKARSADFILHPVHMDHKSFILALDKCSNRYRLGGRTSYRNGKMLLAATTVLARRVPPSPPARIVGQPPASR